MIQDYQTNMVYLARGLSHYGQVCRNLLEALHREQIHAEFLPYTSSYKHVWVRDYMPIQLEKTLFFLYQYWPDYLLGYDGYIPDILKIIKHLDLDRIYTMNNYINTDPSFRKKMLEALSPHFVVEELEYNTPRLNNLSWAYLNFLRVKNTIFVPGLHTKEDQMSLEQIQQFYPDCKVIQVQGCEELARDGGALHCVTWNILANVYEKEEA